MERARVQQSATALTSQLLLLFLMVPLGTHEESAKTMENMVSQPNHPLSFATRFP